MKKKSLFIIPMMFALISCQQEVVVKEVKKDIVNSSSIQTKLTTKKLDTETDSAYAAKLTRVGEILINNPVGFAHAHDLFEQALTIDPNNSKALFYSAFTGILMSMEGSLKRGKKLFEDPQDYDAIIEHLQTKVKYPEFIKFVSGRSSQTEFNDYQDLKRFIQTEVVEAFEEATKKLNKIDGDVNVILTQLKTTNQQIQYNCEDVYEDGYSYTSCDFKDEMTGISALPAKTLTLDSKDIKILASGVKGYSAVFKLYTAYSIKGQKKLSEELNAKRIELDRELTEKEQIEILKNYPEYLALERDHKMDEVVADLESIIEVGMDLEALNNQFCDNESRGNNLIKTICFGESAREEMVKSLDYLSGPQEVTLGQDSAGNEVKILMDLPGYLANPVEDLKSLIPSTYNEDGSVRYTSEPQLNGLFPNRDLLEKLKQLNSN